MIIFNQQALLRTRQTKTQQPNDTTRMHTKKIELKRRKGRKGVNTCVPKINISKKRVKNTNTGTKH